MRWRALAAMVCWLAACGGPREKSLEQRRWDLLAAPLSVRWREAAMAHGGGFTQEGTDLTLKAGQPMSGVVYPTWVEDGLPLVDYAIEYEAMRVAGTDFFATVTFPVGDAGRCVSFVLGGWGGSQVGISSIDGYDASENPTGSRQDLQNGRWYKVRIEVRAGSLEVRLDGRPIVRTNITGRQLGLRAGEIDRCVPFGFATFRSEGRIRGVVVRRLE